MYFFYVDESGNTGKHADPAEPVHWLSAVGVHVASMRAVEADMMALGCDLVERIDESLQQRQPRRRSPSAADEVLGLVIADEQKEVGREVVSSFARWRDGGTAMGYRKRRIRYLVDTVHHVPSTDSWLLQLADCVAYLRNRYEKVQRGKVLRGEALGPADEEIVSLWRTHCAPLLCCDGVWP